MKHLLIRPKSCFTILVFCCLLLAEKAFAQIGIEAAQVSPNGDIGQFYKKSLSANLFYMQHLDDGRFRVRMGLFYTNLKPRMDTVPQYGVLVGGAPGVQLVPGYLVDHDMYMGYLYGDFSYRVIKYKKFMVYAGLGIEGGQLHESYYKVLETVSNTTVNSDVEVVGYKCNANVEYGITDHFDIFAQANYIHIVSTDRSSNFTHTTMGIGINYYWGAGNPNHDIE